MGRIYRVFDKFCIFDIICGFLFGLYLSIHHNDSNLWMVATVFVLFFAFIMTLAPLISAIHAKWKHSEKFPTRAIMEAYILNVGMTAVSLSFAFVIGSFIIGNYIPDEGKLLNLFKF